MRREVEKGRRRSDGYGKNRRGTYSTLQANSRTVGEGFRAKGAGLMVGNKGIGVLVGLGWGVMEWSVVLRFSSQMMIKIPDEWATAPSADDWIVCRGRRLVL